MGQLSPPISFHPHLLSTLQKWSSKVLAIAPSALLPSNHTKFSHSNANGVKTAIQLVDETLLERDRLVERTKVLRGKGVRVGSTNSSKDSQATDDNLDIFDDTDFYQQLLRDVIDARTNGGGTGLDSISENWRAAQKQRKAKKIVDTRASKGRKLRCVFVCRSTHAGLLYLNPNNVGYIDTHISFATRDRAASAVLSTFISSISSHLRHSNVFLMADMKSTKSCKTSWRQYLRPPVLPSHGTTHRSTNCLRRYWGGDSKMRQRVVLRKASIRFRRMTGKLIREARVWT